MYPSWKIDSAAPGRDSWAVVRHAYRDRAFVLDDAHEDTPGTGGAGERLEGVVREIAEDGRQRLWLGWRVAQPGVVELGGQPALAGLSGRISHSDYHTLAVGAGATAIAAIQRGTAQCVMTTQPTVGAMESKKLAYSAIDLATTHGAQAALGGAWPAAGVLALTSWVNSHKETVHKVVDALVATMHWISTHSAADIANELPSGFVQNSIISKNQYVAGLTTDTPAGADG